MKKIALLLAVLFVCLSMAACGEEAKPAAGTTTEAAPVETVPTETEPVTEKVTEPPTEKVTEPPKVEVFTPVVTYNFDDPDNPGWRANAQCKNFAVADGFATCTSTGGDPSICTKGATGVSCDDIDAIRIRYINATGNDNLQIFFQSPDNPNYSEAGSYKEILDYQDSELDSDEWNEIVIYTEDNDLWTGDLKAMRIDLSNAEGDYKIDWISFDKVSYETVG